MDPMTLAALLVVLGGGAALWFASRRAITIAVLDVARGNVTVAHGGIAPPVLADLRDVARRPPIARLRIRIVRASGRAEVHLDGEVSPEQSQRIRNVVGSVPLARLVNARRR